MKFIALALATLAAGVSAHTSETCSIVTVTETETSGHTVPVPSTPATSLPPYPISSSPATSAPYPYVPVPSGTGVPPLQGTPAPSGTGAYTPAPPEFTGAAGSVKVGGVLAGVGAVAALFL
ncbi:uncharacterized protein EI97DRAFT_445360 [Westerdykella ornata]|uniref:GPI anchored serine-rich protein n=1 Tax=Westerdykella ornata TaxID=318751 RepID=A0A6A6J9Q8_WESOR|nr:uncharacterized protein EI97DRAFT_445360 [Westerdykella ornata]KAF2272903.1 hypothetical protein EI97DRAFT_445360 [Westerdykella ornata]